MAGVAQASRATDEHMQSSPQIQISRSYIQDIQDPFVTYAA
jgi:hypothetical protein